MSKITIKETQNSSILKFEFDDSLPKTKVSNLKISTKPRILPWRNNYFICHL